MPGRPKNSRKSYLSKKARYKYVTDKDPVTGKMPQKEKKKIKKEAEKIEEEPEKKESKLDKLKKAFKKQ